MAQKEYDERKKITFPKRFLWGAASSAHQYEGGTHNQWSVWELEQARVLAAQSEYEHEHLENWGSIRNDAKSEQNYVSGEANDHYELFEKDFAILSKLNMNAWRFSIEWSRVEPEEGAWNVEALTHYKKYLAALKKRNIEPMVTLFHFTLPIWFTEKGGFEKRSNIQYFEKFAQKILHELGANFKYVITLNEPEIYAVESYKTGHWPPSISSKKSFLAVLNNLAIAHKRVAKLFHEKSRKYKVSIAKNSSYIYAGDDAVLSQRSAALMQWLQDDYFLKKVIKNCDFLGVNYYFSNRVYGYRVHNPNEEVSDLGWDLQPQNIQYILERLSEKYNLPIIVTENGLADEGDTQRKWWITQTVLGMQRAMENGVKLEGYFHWSLLDNFEWRQGKWPRFGLIAVDYTTQKRTPRPSAVWFAKLLKQIRGV